MHIREWLTVIFSTDIGYGRRYGSGPYAKGFGYISHMYGVWGCAHCHCSSAFQSSSIYIKWTTHLVQDLGHFCPSPNLFRRWVSKSIDSYWYISWWIRNCDVYCQLFLMARSPGHLEVFLRPYYLSTTSATSVHGRWCPTTNSITIRFLAFLVWEGGLYLETDGSSWAIRINAIRKEMINIFLLYFPIARSSWNVP